MTFALAYVLVSIVIVLALLVDRSMRRRERAEMIERGRPWGCTPDHGERLDDFRRRVIRAAGPDGPPLVGGWPLRTPRPPPLRPATKTPTERTPS